MTAPAPDLGPGHARATGSASLNASGTVTRTDIDHRRASLSHGTRATGSGSDYDWTFHWQMQADTSESGQWHEPPSHRCNGRPGHWHERPRWCNGSGLGGAGDDPSRLYDIVCVRTALSASVTRRCQMLRPESGRTKLPLASLRGCARQNLRTLLKEHHHTARVQPQVVYS